jgi:hypothetical protein
MIEFLARHSARSGRHGHDVRVYLTASKGDFQQPPPEFHCPYLFRPAARSLVHAKHAAAGRCLPVVQHSIRNRLGNASLPEGAGERTAKIVPGPTR